EREALEHLAAKRDVAREEDRVRLERGVLGAQREESREGERLSPDARRLDVDAPPTTATSRRSNVPSSSASQPCSGSTSLSTKTTSARDGKARSTSARASSPETSSSSYATISSAANGKVLDLGRESLQHPGRTVGRRAPRVVELEDDRHVRSRAHVASRTRPL